MEQIDFTPIIENIDKATRNLKEQFNSDLKNEMKEIRSEIANVAFEVKELRKELASLKDNLPKA